MANKTWQGDSAGNEGNWGYAANWSPSGVPVAGDNVRIPVDSYAITSGLDQSAVALGDFIVEQGYTEAIGSASAYLQIDPDLFQFAGTGQAYIDVGAANIDLLVLDTAIATGVGKRGLYLKGSNIDTLSVTKGQVGLADRHGETSTVATVVCTGDAGNVRLGAGATAVTVECFRGRITLRCGCVGLNVYGGEVQTEEDGVIFLINVYGGTVYPNSSGTISALTLNGGTTDFTGSGIDRTISTLKQEVGATLVYLPSVVTISDHSAPSQPIRVTTAPA